MAAPRRVLLAQDEPLLRELLTTWLERSGFAVDAVPDGAAAVEAARSGEYEVVLVDDRMPRLDGLDAAREIRSDGPARQPRILVTTFRLGRLDVERAFAAGVDDVIARPVDLDDLRARIALDDRPSR